MSANEKELIRVEDLHKSFGSLQVLKGVTEHVNHGEVVSVIGPSGGGKSTFLRCLNLLETPTSGKIYFEGTDITDKNVDINLHRQKMGMVFQHFNVFNNLTVGKNVTKMFAHAFCQNKKLKKIVFKGTKRMRLEKPHVFINVKNAKVYVPRSRYTTYKKLLCAYGLKKCKFVKQ